jgi:exosome complex component RRP41
VILVGGMTTDIKLIDENGIRIDGRKVDELRPLKIEAGVLKRADGSAYVEMGKNKVLAAVYGPRECHPRHMQNPAKAIVQCKYNMLSFSVSDRKRPGPDRRSVEISKIISEALEYVVFTENFPRASIDVYIEVMQANAGTRCAGLTAASVALADAGIPMKDLIPAVAIGKAAGQVVLDLNKEEDNFGNADLPFAMIPRTGEVVLLQMDGHLTREEFEHAIELGKGACMTIYEAQKDALRRKYATRDAVVVEDEPQTENGNGNQEA